MRTLCLLLLFCLLLAGPVAAASVNLSAAPVAVKVVATPVTVVSLVPQRTLVPPSPLITPPPPGILEIVSEPAGATVTVDGVVKGTTPFKKEVPAGSRTVNITLAGYRDYSSSVVIPAYGMLSVTIALERLPREIAALRTVTLMPMTFAPSKINTPLTISPLNPLIPLTLISNPAGASLILNGTDTGKVTPLTINLSRTRVYDVKLSLDGYRDYTFIANLSSATTPITIVAQLEPEQIPLTILTTPAGATIRLNGTDTGKTTPATLNLSRSRVYELGLSLQGYQDYTVIANLSPYTIPITIYWQFVPGLNKEVSLRPTLVPVKVLKTPGVPEGYSLPVISPAPQGTRVLGGKKQAGAFDSVLGFFNGLFGGPVCLPGQTACGSRCFNLTSDSLNCGSCDYTCFEPAVCSGGECVDSGAGLWTAPVPL